MPRLHDKTRGSSGKAWNRRVDQFPPILVRILARNKQGKPLSTQEIAIKSGLSPMMVAVLSESISWESVSVPVFRAYCHACNFDMTDAVQCKLNEVYLNGTLVDGVRQPPKFTYLKRSPDWEIYYKPLMETYINSIKKQMTV